MGHSWIQTNVRQEYIIEHDSIVFDAPVFEEECIEAGFWFVVLSEDKLLPLEDSFFSLMIIAIGFGVD